jgi:hypothetical protein
MILIPDQITQLKEIIQISLDNLYKNDFTLIEKGGMEQAVSFRYGMYLYGQCQQIEWLRHSDFDMEYNKNGLRPKRTPRRPNGVRPDLIVHTRNSNENNILIIEIKGWWNAELRENDRIKLEDFVHQEGGYKYGYGAFLDLTLEGCTPEYFKGY